PRSPRGRTRTAPDPSGSSGASRCGPPAAAHVAAAPFEQASAALAPRSWWRGRPDGEVGSDQRVAVLPVRLARVSPRSAVVSALVLGVSDRLEVRRVDAATVAAQMVELEPFWNRPDQ